MNNDELMAKAEDRDRLYINGSRSAWASMLRECLRNLGWDSEEAKNYSWISEREATISMLRSICERHGDNDWPDDLYLPDILEKHLDDYLEEK